MEGTTGIHYWRCEREGCGKLFEDADGAKSTDMNALNVKAFELAKDAQKQKMEELQEANDSAACQQLIAAAQAAIDSPPARN